jgi:hypothetical protein
MSTPSYPIRLVGGQDLERSRLTVFFRIFLLIPHFIVLALYGIVVFFAAIAAWFAALFTGRVPDLFLVNARYPAFGDTPGSLPADQTALPPLP